MAWEDRLLQIVCYRAREETAELEMDEKKESVDYLHDFQAAVTSGFSSREGLWVLLPDTKGGCEGGGRQGR